MANDTSLIAFGIASVIWPIYYSLSGFLSGRRHLCTALNAVIAGYVPFVGLSTIAFARQSGAVQTPYANYTTEHVFSMMGAVILFTIVMLLTYHRTRIPARIKTFLQLQPPRTHWQPLVITVLACGIALMCLLPRFGVTIPVVSQVMVRCLSAAVIFSSLFAFSSWWMDRGNILSLALFLGVFSMCAILAILTGGGRRALLGVFLALGVYAYWKNEKHLRRTNVVILGAIFVTLGLVFINGYNQVRHKSNRIRGGNMLSDPIAKLQALPAAILNQDLTDERLTSDLGQNATNCSLYSIYLSQRMKRPNRHSGLRYPSYFHSVTFLVANPIPRFFWKGKPNSLGYMLPQQHFPGTKVNWGPGLAGHFYHEGGLVMAVFYGVFVGFFLKIIDGYIAMDPSNLFAIGFLASCIPQLIVLPRGDMAIAMLNVVFAGVVLLLVRQVSLWLYGRALLKNSQFIDSKQTGA